jgi:hypothetical protein
LKLDSFLEDAPENQVVFYCCADLENQPAVTCAYCIDAASLKAISLESNNSVSISSLTDQLYRELNSDICAARFSFLGGKYKSFSTEDLSFIELSKRL